MVRHWPPSRVSTKASAIRPAPSLRSSAAAELRRLGAGRIADAFVETRLGGQWRTTYGMLDSRHDARMIIDTLYPPVT